MIFKNGPKRVVFVRHAESEGNIAEQGSKLLDKKANHEFMITNGDGGNANEQCRLTRKVLAKESFDHYYHSGFLRAGMTARAIRPNNEWFMDPRLDELLNGPRHLVSADRVKLLDPFNRELYERIGFYYNKPPRSESFRDMEIRVLDFLKHLQLNHQNDDLLVVTHGNWLQGLWRIISKKKPEDIQKRRCNGFHYDNCSITTMLHKDDHFYFEHENKTDHLQ